MVLPQVETQFQGNIPLVREYRKIFPHQGEGSGKNEKAATRLGMVTALELGAGRSFHSAEMPEI